MAGSTIDLLVVGVSHKTAPVSVRERLAVEPEAVGRTLGELTALPAVREAVMLSTCNRVELYVATDDADRAAQEIAEALGRRAEVRPSELAAHLYQQRDTAAVQHLFRVAASLDSLVVGEPQILGQTKQAHDEALQHGSSGTVLNACFQYAFRVARRIRRETEIAKNPVSVSSIAVEFARQIVGDFAGRRVLVVSAGKMAKLAVRALRDQGATVVLTNRTRSRAEALAGQYGATVADWNDLAGALATADIVIASTGAQRPVLTLELMTRVQKARKGRPLALIDIAAPRDVEPSVRDLADIYVADIDDLQQVAGAHREEREDEAAEAEAIVSEELERFLRAWRGRQLAPTVTALRKHFLGLAEAEAQRICASIGNLDERTKKAICDVADGLAKKLLHQPQMALRQDDGDGVPLVLAVQRLFKLEVTDVAAREVDETEAGQSRGGPSSSARPTPSPEERNPSEGSDLDDKKAAGR
jgi:glutamyl-tRNA reductase